MTEPDPGADAHAARHWEHARAELDRTVARYFACERLALLLTALIWTVLAASSAADWDPLVKWLPCALNVLIALRAVTLATRVHTLERVLASAERHFSVPPAISLEGAPGTRRVGFLSVVLFWALLLGAAGVLPYFYIEQSTTPDYQNDPSMTYRVPGDRAHG